MYNTFDFRYTPTHIHARMAIPSDDSLFYCGDGVHMINDRSKDVETIQAGMLSYRREVGKQGITKIHNNTNTIEIGKQWR